MKRESSVIVGGAILGVFFAFGAAMADIQYFYDNTNRLMRVRYENGTNILYCYDEAGNRVAQVVGPDPAPPDIPSNPSLPNGSVNAPLSLDLSWTGGDPYGDSVIYKVFLDTNSHPATKVSSVQTTSLHIDNLDCGTTYYWSVTSVDQYGAITYGPVWNFTTDPGPPIKNQRTGDTYSTLGDAYYYAAHGDTILIQNVQLTENFRANLDKAVTIKGGYNCSFNANSEMTVIKGAPVIERGTVTMKNLVISK